MKKLRFPILFAGAFFGILVGRFVAPTWLYIDHYEVREMGEELIMYRGLYASMVFGITVSVFTLIAARIVGLGISAMIVVSSISVLVMATFERARSANMLDASMI